MRFGAAEQLEILGAKAPAFDEKVSRSGLAELKPGELKIFQINVGKWCNKACKHCHVDASPSRTEAMSRETMEKCFFNDTATTEIYTLVVPAGATNLKFTIAGGTGDADMYVRLGAAPTTTSYNCRPYLSGNNETCTFAAPTAGTYYVRVRAYSAFSGVTLSTSFTP